LENFVAEHTLPIPGGSLFRLHVSIDEHNWRLDTLLANRFAHYSRTFFQQVVTQNGTVINNLVAKKPSTLVKTGDTVDITFPTQAYDRKDTSVFASKPAITIMLEHQHFLVINKPAGWIVHAPHKFSTEVSVVDWLTHHYADTASVGNADRPGIVHRLDKDTSGLLILARTNYGHQTFSTLFANRLIHKTYVALVTGTPPTSGTIDLPIGRDPITKVKMRTFSRLRPSDTTIRHALTEYHLVQQFPTMALLQLQLHTGRTHQIRVHCAALGHPLVGDATYGSSSDQIGRHALHASTLQFIFDGQEYKIESAIPDDMAPLIKLENNNKVLL
jgi:23S rRNA pseudouridine1911/1915/1917 synthase